MLTAPPFPAHAPSWRRGSASSRRGSRGRAKQRQRPRSGTRARGRVVRSCQGSGERGGPGAPRPYASASLPRSCDRPQEGAHCAAAEAQEGEWELASGEGRSLEARGGRRMVPGPGGGTWRTQLSESQFLSTPVPWVAEHHVPHSAGLGGARPDAQRVFSAR